MARSGFDVLPSADDGADQRALRPVINGEEVAYDPGPRVDEDEDRNFLPLRKLREQYLDYLHTKSGTEIAEQKDSRRMYHGAQMTWTQLEVLRKRRQPPMTWNRINRKINGVVGLVSRGRSDPKVLPRRPDMESNVELANQALLYVLDETGFRLTTDGWCLLQCAIEGICGVQIVLSQGDKGDPDISLPWVIGDEFFYDPKSYKADFSDARYLGISKWVDVNEAIEMFSDKAELLNGLVEGDSDMTTNSDREYRWIITATRRIRLVEHWYKYKNKWRWALYAAQVKLDQGVSPFFDEKGKSAHSFLMFSAAIDHDGDRYSFVRNLKGPQDALNQGKMKMLHIANTKLVKGEKGAVDNVEKARQEVARPDGYIEVNPGKQWEVVDTKADLTAFSQFTEDAKNELDSWANINLAQLNGQALAQISGRALELLRQPGMAELAPFILNYRAWKLQLYRLLWSTIQRYWTGERWIRITRDQKLAQFIQINGTGLDQWGRPVLVNALGALDVDILIEEGPDIASLMAETYDILKNYPPGTFPPQVLIEVSSLPRSEKDRLLQMMAPKPPPPDPMAELVKRLQLEGAVTELAKKGADVHKTRAQAEDSLASAAEKHFKIGDMQHENLMDSQELSRDTLMQALELIQKSQQADREHQLAQQEQQQQAQQPQTPQ